MRLQLYQGQPDVLAILIYASESVKVNISKARRVLIGSLNSVVFQGSFDSVMRDALSDLAGGPWTGHG